MKLKEVIKQHNGTVYKYVHCNCGKIHVYEKRIKFGFKDKDIYGWYLIKHLQKRSLLIENFREE